DIYFHVAGIGYENLTLDLEREVEIIKTNAVGFSRMICCAYRYFRDNRIKGQIAAITSVAGTKGIGRLSAYSASKKFGQTYLVALEQLAHEEGADVSFTDIRPGWVRTPLVPDDRKFPMEMSVDYVVPYIIKAIVRKERVSVIDWRWNALVGAWRNIPNALWTKMNVKISDPDTPLPALTADLTGKGEQASGKESGKPESDEM
ncbi:MAG: SDR family NAD(P)-dependent oxidoreductase, partial [Muribaculaceae bacterium]|nr:SDR family NAD(P)-dependent oxidoreductase [Muribaculaceae bacterium]